MTVFDDSETTLLTLAASRPNGTVLMSDLGWDGTGVNLEPAAVRLHTYGVFDLREVPQLHYRLTVAGWAEVRRAGVAA